MLSPSPFHRAPVRVLPKAVLACTALALSWAGAARAEGGASGSASGSASETASETAKPGSATSSGGHRCADSGVRGEPTSAQRCPPPLAVEENDEDSDGEELSPTPRETELTVSGARLHPLSPPRAPHVAGSVLRGERLAQPGSGAAEALREAPGVQVTQVGGMGAPATASLRGATAAQTPIYLGSVRINDEVGGAANLADVPLFLIDRVEVYRSHAPPELEAGVGGAVLFEPRRPRASEISLGVLGGSYGTRGLKAYASDGGAHHYVLAGAELMAADNDYDYFDDRGTVFDPDDDGAARRSNMDSTQRTFWLLGGIRSETGRTELVVNHTDRDQGAPKLALTPSRSARVHNRRDLFAVSSKLQLDDYSELFVATTATQSTTTVDDPEYELGPARNLVETPGERLEQSLGVTQRHASGLRTTESATLTVDRMRRFERWEDGVTRELLSARRLGVRPALSADLPLGGGWSVNGSGAARCYDTSTSELEACSTLVPEGRLGGAFEFSGGEVYAGAGHYNRLPTLGELYGLSQLVLGNPALSPESGETAELGLRLTALASGDSPRLFVDISGFVRKSRDLISYVRTAQGYLSPLNNASSRTLGGELSVGARPLDGVETSLEVSLLDPRNTSSDRTTVNDILPFVSRATVSGQAGYTARFDGVCNEAGVNVRGNYQSSRYADPAGKGVIPSQTTFDVELLGRFIERSLTTRLRLANVADARRFDVVGFPLPGRSAFFSVEATW